MTFIYALKCPITGRVRYIGKSNNPQKRLSRHLGEDRDRNCHRKTWLNSLTVRGLRPILEILSEVPESEWQAWECAYIEYFRESGCDLTNNTNGGDGVVNLSPEAKERGRLKQVGRKQSPENVAKRMAGRLGKKRKDNTSGFVGVCRNSLKTRWLARIQVENKEIFSGSFKKIEDAIFARSLAFDKYFSKIA